MFSIKPRRCYDCNEKLRSICVWTTISHSQAVRLLEPMLMKGEFVLKIASPYRLASSSISVWTSSLIHKSLDNPMENHSIIVLLFHQFDEVLTCFRAIFSIELYLDIPMSRIYHHILLNSLCMFWCDQHLRFFFGCPFIYYVSMQHGSIFLEFWLSTRENIESWPFKRCANQNRISCLSLPLIGRRPSWISHNSSLIKNTFEISFMFSLPKNEFPFLSC